MSVLEGEAVWRRVIKVRALAFRDRSNEICSEGSACIAALSADQVDCIVLQVMSAATGTLVGIGNGAPVLEPPLARGSDRAILSAGAGRGGSDDTTVIRVEAVGHLNHHGYASLPAAFVSDVFVARNQSLARGYRSVRLDVGSIKRAVAATRRRIDEGAIIVVDRKTPKFFRRRMGRIGKARGRGAAQSRLTEAGGQQVVGNAVVVRVDDLRFIRFSSFTGYQAHADCQQYCSRKRDSAFQQNPHL